MKEIIQEVNIMKVELSMLERVLMNLSWRLDHLSHAIREAIYKKYDPEQKYNTHAYHRNHGELSFSNKEES